MPNSKPPLGLEALLRQTSGDVVDQLSKLRIQVEREKAEVAGPLAQISALIGALHPVQVQADDFADRYGGRPDLLHHIEAVREAFVKAMDRAAASVKSQASPMPQV